MAVDLDRLSTNARGWLSSASLAEIATLLGAVQDVLISRRCAAASLIAEAEVLVRRQMDGKAEG